MYSDKVVRWILPTQREFILFYNCKVCVCSTSLGHHDIYWFLFLPHDVTCSLTDINCTKKYIYLLFSSIWEMSVLCQYSQVSLPEHLNRHRCTNAPSMTHILTTHLHHSAPETCSLSGESSRFNPLLLPGCLDCLVVVKLPMMDAHRIKAVCVCVCMCVVSQMKSFMGSIVGWYMEFVNHRLSTACGSEFMMIITL